MKPFSPILLKVALVLTIGLLLGQGVAGLVRYLGAQSQQESIYQREMVQVSGHLARSLELPLWNFDYDLVQRLCRETLNNPYVAGVTIWTAKEQLFYSAVQTGTGDLQEVDVKKTTTPAVTDWSGQSRDGRIYYETRTLGHYRIYFNDQIVGTILRAEVVNILRDTSIITVLLVIILTISLQQAVLRPLETLNSSVIHFGKRTFKNFEAVAGNNEISSLAHNFQIMEEQISRHEEAMYHQLYTELITGLPNRNKLLADLEVSINPVVFLLNLNSFKEINEFYGNVVGDQVLVEVGKRLRALQIPGESMLYKMPADEYVFLFDREEMPEADCRQMAETILNELEISPVQCGEQTIYTSATIGVAGLLAGPGSDSTAHEKGELFIRSDMALKKAQLQQARFLVYDDSLDMIKELENNITWSKKLNEAVRFGRVVLFFQPIINNQTFKVEKFECLIRVKEENGQVHSPYYFLGVAKKTRLYPYLTRIVVAKAFEAFRETPYEFSINVSIDDIVHKDTRPFIMQTLRQNPATAQRAVFEILESEGIENYSAVKEFIDEVKDFGCKIAIDDFGSGYSNFGHILKLDVNYIKIDASLIKNIHQDRNSQVVTKTIANFARELGIKTIAEFVSSREVLETLLQLGIDYSQGFYFGEPKEVIQT